MGLFFYTKKGSIISTVDLPTTEIIEPEIIDLLEKGVVELYSVSTILKIFSNAGIPEAGVIFLRETLSNSDIN